MMRNREILSAVFILLCLLTSCSSLSGSDHIDFEVESRNSQNASYFLPLGDRSIGFSHIEAHDGFYYYKIILKGWPKAEETTLEQKSDDIVFSYSYTDSDNNNEDTLFSFRSKQEFPLDNFVVKINGDKYNNDSIKYTFGFE